MNTEINDGGPAFPCPTGSDGGVAFSGMSLRDWFAGQVLTGWLASFGPEATPPKPYDGVSEFAYGVADAMIAQRDKK